MKVIAKNSFHNTEAQLIVKAQLITAATAAKLRKKLCAVGCECFWQSTTFYEHTPGYRNSENCQVKLHKTRLLDGSILLEV
jgi:hypothetical protein